MLRTFTACIFLLFLSFSAFAQFSVEGKLVDASNKGIPYASIALSSPQDSSVLQFSIATEDGSYKMTKVASGEYILVVACVGYEVEYVPVSVVADVQNKIIVLTSGTVSMKEVMIRAKNIPVLMNGDTIVYNSNSFKTSVNATVEDLIKKLPGVQVGKDGNLTAEGEQVAKVLINGKEFFGGDVKAATKNIDASLVDKVEVIDKKKDDDEFTNEDNTETEKVINLVLKEEHAQGYFGNVAAGYGTSDLYNVHGNINFFRDATQLSIIGGLNNISRMLYDWQEMQSLNSFSIKPLNDWNTISYWNSGISTNKGVGANLHFEPAKSLKVDVSYVLNNVSTIDTGRGSSEVYLPKNTLYSNSLSNSVTTGLNHQVNSKIEYTPDTLNQVIIRFQNEAVTGSGIDASRVFNYLENESNILNSGVTREDKENNNKKLASKIHWTKKNKGNTKNFFQNSFYYGTSSVQTDENSYFKTTDNVLLAYPTDEAPLINRALSTSEKTMATTSAFQFKINEKWTLRPGLNWMGSKYNHDFDWTPTNSQPLLSNSPHGDVRSDNLEYFVHLIYKLDSFTTIRFVPEYNQMIESRTFETDTTHSFSFNQGYFIPYIFIHSAKPHKHRLYASVRATVQRPQTNQILPITDSTNPYSTIIGNIELKNYMNYSLYVNFKKMFGLGKYISYYTWSNYNLNPVVSSVSVDDNNYSVRELLNYKYSFRGSQQARINWPLTIIKGTGSLNFSQGYSESFSLQNGQDLHAISIDYGIGTGLQWNEFDKFSVGVNYNISNNTGKINQVENNNFLSQDIWTELVWNPTDKLEISTDLDLEIYGKNAVVGAQTIPILSAEINYNIDTLNRWSIGVEAFDILDQNRNIWRYWGQNRFVQSQNMVLRQYFMATIRYKIKKSVKEKPEIKS